MQILDTELFTTLQLRIESGRVSGRVKISQPAGRNGKKQSKFSFLFLNFHEIYFNWVDLYVVTDNIMHKIFISLYFITILFTVLLVI